jgi:hypothetical protein
VNSSKKRMDLDLKKRKQEETSILIRIIKESALNE